MTCALPVVGTDVATVAVGDRATVIRMSLDEGGGDSAEAFFVRRCPDEDRQRLVPELLDAPPVERIAAGLIRTPGLRTSA